MKSNNANAVTKIGWMIGRCDRKCLDFQKALHSLWYFAKLLHIQTKKSIDFCGIKIELFGHVITLRIKTPHRFDMHGNVDASLLPNLAVVYYMIIVAVFSLSLHFCFQICFHKLWGCVFQLYRAINTAKKGEEWQDALDEVRGGEFFSSVRMLPTKAKAKIKENR